MFDNDYHYYNTTYQNKEISVTEKKAPTDESIKLLNEFQQKALDNVVAKFSTYNNILQVTGATFNNPINNSIELHCKIVLNGREHIIKVECTSWEAGNTTKDGWNLSLCERLYEKICNKLALEIMQPFFKELSEKRFL